MSRKMLKSKIRLNHELFVDENTEILPFRKEDAGQAGLKKVSW